MNQPFGLLALAVATIGLTGCDGISFLYPLSEDPRDLAIDIDISGAFHAPDGDQWLFEKHAEGRYRLTWRDKEESLLLDASLVRISNFVFLDVTSSQEGTSIRGHFFARLRMDGDAMEISWLDVGWMKKKLAGERALTFEKPCARGDKDCSYVVTASTAQLQNFLMRHALDGGAFGKPDILRRR